MRACSGTILAGRNGRMVPAVATQSPRWPACHAVVSFRTRGGRLHEGTLSMARSMWRGAIQFGLVTIPVKLYLATESGGIGFNMLHATCLNRIQMKVYCPFHDEVIPRSETVRGYEWSKGKYVVVDD